MRLKRGLEFKKKEKKEDIEKLILSLEARLKEVKTPAEANDIQIEIDRIEDILRAEAD